ncbi:MAG: hypothetical protein FJ288_10360 [Planctomycetes bacterium]|nr:hypothetical protein [Planctomycetota bacterium]
MTAIRLLACLAGAGLAAAASAAAGKDAASSRPGAAAAAPGGASAASGGGSAAAAGSASAAAESVAALIRRAGSTDDEAERLALLRRLADHPQADAGLRAEAASLAAAVSEWNTARRLDSYDRKVRKTLDYDFGVAPASPLWPVTCLYRGRMLTWITLEYGGVKNQPERRRQHLDKAAENFRAVRDAFPENRIARMYLGEPVPPAKAYAAPEGAPAWAAAQREALERLADIIIWWIDNRMQADGQYGGGWGDDCEMWRWWVPALIAFEDPRIAAAQARFSQALMGQPHMSGGYTIAMTDVEHSAEDSTDAILPMMHLAPDDPAWQARALRLADLMENIWTGRNARGHLQFRSTFFSVQKTDAAPDRACDTPYHVRAVAPAMLYWQRTGERRIGRLLTDWLRTWVDAAARSERGKPAGIVPAAIHWPDGGIGGAGPDWWDPRNYAEATLYEWPSALGGMCDALLLAWHMTRDESFLEPLRSMAAVRQRYLESPPRDSPAPGSEAWCGSKLGLLGPTLAKYRALTGRPDFDRLLARDYRAWFALQQGADRRALVAALDEAAHALRINFPGYTSEVRYTDRVLSFPTLFGDGYMFQKRVAGIPRPSTDLLYSTATGDPGRLEGLAMNAVRWLTPPRDIAALVARCGPDDFRAELYHFGESARPMGAELYLLAPGAYAVAVSPDGGPPGRPAALKVSGRRARVAFELPPRRLCTLTIQRSAAE